MISKWIHLNNSSKSECVLTYRTEVHLVTKQRKRLGVMIAYVLKHVAVHLLL
jgi:hypothetical protein